MGAWEELTRSEREVIVESIRENSAGPSMDALADRLEHRQQPELDGVLALYGDMLQSAAAERDAALISTVKALHGMTMAMAEGLGGLVQVIDAQGMVATDDVLKITEKARAALLVWAEARTRVEAFVEAVGDG